MKTKFKHHVGDIVFSLVDGQIISGVIYRAKCCVSFGDDSFIEYHLVLDGQHIGNFWENDLHNSKKECIEYYLTQKKPNISDEYVIKTKFNVGSKVYLVTVDGTIHKGRVTDIATELHSDENEEEFITEERSKTTIKYFINVNNTEYEMHENRCFTSSNEAKDYFADLLNKTDVNTKPVF